MAREDMDRLDKAGSGKERQARRDLVGREKAWRGKVFSTREGSMHEDHFPIAAVATKRIYSQVAAREFELFRQRAKAEGLRIDEALNAIAAAYASGDYYVLSRDKSKQQSVSFYLEAHAKQA
jgi:hypothetical protein